MASDKLILEFDRAVRTVFVGARSHRSFPGEGLPEAELSEQERVHAGSLMRVNHVGEICAQALYQGQSITSRNPVLSEALREAADEETEHLAWTEQRIAELGGRKSLLNPLWYLGALTIGLVAGRCGDRWNLGFLAETERQVQAHLEGHLELLPETDARSREILNQMRIDEIRHAVKAVDLGGVKLPAPVKAAMKLAARAMTRTAYRI